MVLARLTDYIRERWEFRQQLIVGALSLLIGSEHASCKFMPRWLWWEVGRGPSCRDEASMFTSTPETSLHHGQSVNFSAFPVRSEGSKQESMAEALSRKLDYEATASCVYGLYCFCISGVDNLRDYILLRSSSVTVLSRLMMFAPPA
jgi:hypothetical protein